MPPRAPPIIGPRLLEEEGVEEGVGVLEGGVEALLSAAAGVPVGLEGLLVEL